jgi:hypothetical protein
MSETSSYNIISKVQIPNGSTYEIKPSNNANINTEGVYFVTVTGTASALTGSINDLDSYYDGLKIIIYNDSGANTNSTCTLNINNLGAINIKRYNTNDVGSIYNKAIALLCYVDGVFYHNNYYYSDTTEDSFSVMNIRTDSAYVLRYALCAVTAKDRISSFTTNTTDSTGSKDITTLDYRIGLPLFYRSGTKIVSNTTATSAYTLYENKKDMDIRYSMCSYAASRVADVGPTYFYMCVDVNSENGFYTPKRQPTSVSGSTDHIVCKSEAVNELLNGNFYIYIGVRSASNKYTVALAQENPLYYYEADSLVEYNVWASGSIDNTNNFGTLAPIAGQDIYASPEYPAIVCIDYDYTYGVYDSAEQNRGRGLLYDFMAVSSSRNMNLDWGYAILTHDVSVGQRVNPSYLHKKWTYTLHTNLADTTIQGANIVDGIHASQYRYFDSSVYDFLVENQDLNYSTEVSQPIPKREGPTLYGMLIYDYNNNSINIGSTFVSVCISCMPYAHFNRPGNPFNMVMSDGFIGPYTFDENCGPIFYYMGRVNYSDINGTPTSISLDFSNSTFQAYDYLGNQRSIPSYPYSAGAASIMGDESFVTNASIKYAVDWLDTDINCHANTDTSIFITKIPDVGVWSIDAMLTINAARETGVDCYLSYSDSSTGGFDDFYIISNSTALVPPKTSSVPVRSANIYLQGQSLCLDKHYGYIMLSVRPSGNLVTVKGTRTDSDLSTGLKGVGSTGTSSTRIRMIRLLPCLPPT